ncbi:MAG: universal stress protein [Desulfobacterales bacterium]|nr:universal stress protein [Desulfobacterales bacterium]
MDINIKQIVCCMDFSQNSDNAFVMAHNMAKKYNAKLYIVHVLPPPINPLSIESEGLLPEDDHKTLVLKIEEKMVQLFRHRIHEDVETEFVVLHGHVSTEILEFLEDQEIDLVVMGSFGLSGMGLVFFGSNAKRVAHKAPCSVMIVRKPETLTE